MKKQLSVRYYFTILLMLSFVISNAQIIYTDVIPDQTISANDSVYNLDLDNNGTVDFEIKVLTLAGTHPRAEISFTSYPGNYVSSYNTYVAYFDFGTIPDLSNLWSAATIFMATDAWGFNAHSGIWVHSILGNWTNKTDKYVTLKLNVNGNTHYGWARLDTHVSSNGTAEFTIKDYAYDSNPNNIIPAGDDGTGTLGIFLNPESLAISIFPNPSRDYLIISFQNKFVNGDLSITDINGKIIYKSTVSGKQNIELDTRNFSEGVYVFRIHSSEYEVTKKFTVVK